MLTLYKIWTVFADRQSNSGIHLVADIRRLPDQFQAGIFLKILEKVRKDGIKNKLSEYWDFFPEWYHGYEPYLAKGYQTKPAKPLTVDERIYLPPDKKVEGWDIWFLNAKTFKVFGKTDAEEVFAKTINGHELIEEIKDANTTLQTSDDASIKLVRSGLKTVYHVSLRRTKDVEKNGTLASKKYYKCELYISKSATAKQ